MATQIITVLCEGPHDVAFITKILKTTGFKSDEGTKLSKYPSPINQLLTKEVTKTNIGELNLQTARKVFLPSKALKRGNIHIFLYEMGGDSKILSNSPPLLREFISFIPKEEGGLTVLPSGTELSLLYFLDADDKGILKRIEELNKVIYENFKEEPFKKHTDFPVFNGIKLGAFVFTGSDNNTGKLEDILIPLMTEDNESIFQEAESYLSKHFKEERLFPLKLSINHEGKMYEERSKVDKLTYYTLKSRIGVVGQLQKSGSNNVVCIGQTDYLTLEKIQSNGKCQEIIAFFEEFISK